METLIIGNGFDLEHDLKTRYTDFLNFIQLINSVEKYGANFKEDNDSIQGYIQKLYSISEKKLLKEEIVKLIDSNIWIEYFLKIYRSIGKNWIDFESEISLVIQDLDNIKEMVEKRKKPDDDLVIPLGMKKRLNSFSKEVIGLCKSGDEEKFKNCIKKWIEDLKRMIRLLEIYLIDYVQKVDIKYYSPSILGLNPDRIISFNYTNTYERVYTNSKRNIKYNYIHGKTNNDSSVETCNMVLGIDEYLEPERQKKKTELIEFKKFFQRIHKKTDCDYMGWFDKDECNANNSVNYVYIFGHSLDVTDADVLERVFNCPNTVVTVFYYDEKSYGNQIANLTSWMGSDELLRKVYGSRPTIRFEKQKTRRNISDDGFEISKDIYYLEHLYEYSNAVAKEVIDRVTYQIENKNVNYFCNQENIISIYNIFEDIKLAKENEEKLLYIAKEIYDKMPIGTYKQVDYEIWNTHDCFGEHECSNETKNFINLVNEYNLKQYEINRLDKNNILDNNDINSILEEIRNSNLTIEGYKEILINAMKIMDASNYNMKIIDALVSRATSFDEMDVYELYNHMKDTCNNPIYLSRINYIKDYFAEKAYAMEQRRLMEQGDNLMSYGG